MNSVSLLTVGQVDYKTMASNYDMDRERKSRRQTGRPGGRNQLESDPALEQRRARRERADRRALTRGIQEKRQTEKHTSGRPQVVQKEFVSVTAETGTPSQGITSTHNPGNTTQELRNQGVVFSDEEHNHQSPHAGDDNHWETTQDLSSCVSELEEEGEEINIVRERVAEIQDRTEQYQIRRQQMENQVQELQRRENVARLQERELQQRKAHFQEGLKERQDNVRKEMRKKMQEQMYQDSLTILQNMETEMEERRRAAEEREYQLRKREEALRQAEASWRNQERLIENSYLEQVRQEIEREMREKANLQPSPQGPGQSRDISGGARKKNTFYSLPVEKQTSLDNQYEEEMQQTQLERDIESKLKREHEETETERKLVWNTENQPAPTCVFDRQFRTHKDDSSENTSEGRPITKATQQEDSSVKEERAVKSQELSLHEGIYPKPYVGKFSGSDPVPKSESSFDDWKLEVESLKAAKIYPDISIAQAMRKSLSGRAKSVLQGMLPTAGPNDIIARLESNFGNVASGEAMLQEFYTAQQRFDEDIVDWGLRLENILQRAIEKEKVTGDRNDMLKSKFWRSLHSQDLKNATKMYKDSMKSFEEFRRKVREEEYEMRKAGLRQDQKQKAGRQTVQHQPVVEMSADHLELLKSLVQRMEIMERNQRAFGRGRRRGRGRGRGRDGQQTQRNDTTESMEKEEETQVKAVGPKTDALN